MSSCESSPQRERRGSTGPNAVLLIEEGGGGGAGLDPLGAVPKLGAIPPPPQTPSGQRRAPRRGSMLELSGSITRDTIPEENYGNGGARRPSWLPPVRQTPRLQVRRQQTLGPALISAASSATSDDSSENEDMDCLMKPNGNF
ncbi:PREDICTED: uncharacterized protein LOC108566708 [Nicrophorus vespilloides]|uniref:Uncharacterized protein LOC108566708 n=1 Tax=Nicrophorus vespilloides TaxID=110193 RepID=A0ABM1N5Z7_NICVS|nr:PREDICTED: uncharacterized protein LOC108566708 [Nicrophorus vespilloides]